MPVLTRVLTLGVECDASGCVAKLVAADPTRLSYSDEFERALVAAGWSCWYGASRRYYCPDHGPKSRRMRRVY